MSNEKILNNIDKLLFLSKTTKVNRLLNNPINYLHAIFFREFIYPKTKVSKKVTAKTFFGGKMNILLPSSTDIFITKGKSHISEIRLALFLTKTFKKNDIFIDVGAHYGYFTLLAEHLIGSKGKIFSFEASKKSFGILNLNCETKNNIETYNLAVSDTHSFIDFYEFPNLYSEYNSFNIDQYRKFNWFKNNEPKPTKIETLILSDFISDKKIHPNIIKIDVEGAEFKVIKGLVNYIKNNEIIIIMEFLSNNRFNKEHLKALEILKSCKYDSHIILKDGHLLKTNDITEYLSNNQLESDNIVFKKQLKY